MSRTRIALRVDEHLLWVLPMPEHLLGSARPASSDALSELGGPFREPRPAELMERLVDAAARVVAAALADLPELPYVGEPFGGAEGTD